MWLIIIFGNIVDVIISWFGWPTELQHADIYTFDLNILFNIYVNHIDNLNVTYLFYQLLILLIAVKILFISMIYWFTKLADKLKVSNMKWIMLLPFALITLGIDVFDVYALTSLLLCPL
ncbi:hypothetical protein B6F84_10445 [Acidianus manzaensis]|uniref:DUF5658 domain-containing protein n=2 Tax=Acidianus manzaensis TaxID=282676 RepID=A0A1W6K1J9_9CREN|nr:hypothetical protein B6F84_10445 [Acidianus manzaensis]